MRVLIDTHIFIWAISEDQRLSSRHGNIFRDRNNELVFSVVSVWEILIKFRLGKLKLPAPAADFLFREIMRNRIELLPILPEHLVELEALPLIHHDPFDRMLVAQARAEKMPIVTGDGQIRKYEVPIL